jgi:predicted nucleic acid-binding protein
VELIDDVGSGAVAVDTAVFIYFIEEEPRFLPHILPLFIEADRGERTLVTSALTLLEVLVVPYRAGDTRLADRYDRLLTSSRGIRMVELGHEHLRAAARLRAATGAKTPDAIQLVAALTSGCRTFVTNDRRLPSIPGLTVLQLSSYVDRRPGRS